MAYHITDACTGCTLCAKVCPVMAISGTVKQPHSINEKRCIDCGVCARACTRSAIADETGAVPPRVPRKDWPKPVFDSARCSACHICVNACTAGSLEISLPKHKGDLRVAAYLAQPKTCVGCGFCADECPLGVITMEQSEPEIQKEVV